jgi:hypothetical protein
VFFAQAKPALKKLSTQAEPGLKKAIKTGKKFMQAESELKKCLRRLTLR